MICVLEMDLNVDHFIFLMLPWLYTLQSFFFFAQLSLCNSQTADLTKTLVWGPAIENPDFNLPVRYFFVQLVDSNGANLTTAPETDYIRFELIGEGINENYGCRASRAVIDRNNGSYIVRFRLRTSCKQIELRLTTNAGLNIGNFPIALESKNGLNHDQCYCPVSDINQWLRTTGCPSSYRLIKQDLSVWPHRSVNFSNVLEQAIERWASHPGAHSFCHYQFINNQIYRHCYGEHIGFKMFSDAIFLALTRMTRLPDTELLINLGDWPLEKRASAKNPIPLISWCGSVDTKDIVFPTYELTEATLQMMGRQSLDVQSVQGMTVPVWVDKIDKAIFRGRDSRQERLDLVLLSRKHPEDIEAGITRFFFFTDEMDKYGPEVPHLPFEDFFKYRYQLNIDGTVAAYRLAYLLAGDSLILKQDSPYYEHFYKELIPWIHYIPLKRDLSDVLEKIHWARNNENKVLSIIQNAQKFVSERLQPKDIFCYHVLALNAYSQILSKSPEMVKENMEKVKQPVSDSPCMCPDTMKDKDEL